MSSDPDFSLAEAVHVGGYDRGDRDPGRRRRRQHSLSRREANEEQAWEKLKEMMEEVQR